MKILALICIILLAVGCATVKEGATNLERAVTSYGDEIAKDTILADINDSEYAFVTGRFAGRNTWIHNSISYNERYTHDDAVELAWAENPINDKNSGYPIYKINPGKYTLVRFTAGGCSASQEGRIENEALKLTGSYYASFEVEAGKLYYLGDINVQGDCREFIVTDNLGFARGYMEENYPNLKGFVPETSDIMIGKYFE